MKIIIFAGGSGRRLWPICRVKSPKHFEPIIEKNRLRSLRLVACSTSAVENEPATILWGDNNKQNVPNFHRLLAATERLLQNGTVQIFFICEHPRFANGYFGQLGPGPRLSKNGDIPYY